MKYIPTIGLEIHAELKTKSKMFCSCANDSLETNPNANICPVCMGHPGTLPVANQNAVRKVIKVGLALNCKIPEKSKFDRKNYFYPDLPKGYQISQYDAPLCKEGYLDVAGKKIRVTRVHLEEDTGKLVHPGGANYSLVDFNRAGVPLMELVTEPDITNAREASQFAKELQLILRYLEVSDADMEKGQMRVEANVSIRVEGAKTLGTKVEVKNLNSFRAVEGAIAFETKRQEEVLQSGGKVVQETRGWDENKGETFSQREKEEAHDYRYFPEPDLPPLDFTQDFIREIKAELPELPQQRTKRFKKEYKLSKERVDILIQDQENADIIENAIKEKVPKKDWSKLERSLDYLINYAKRDLIKDKVSSQNLGDFIEWVIEGNPSSTNARRALNEMIETGTSLKKGEEMKDSSEIEVIAKDIIAQNPKAVEDYKKGKETALQFLIGQMMSKTRGTINPDAARKILLDLVKI